MNTSKISSFKTRGAVIVTRVSGDEQAKEGTSLETQLDACRAKALSLTLPIVAEYEDAAISGAFLLARPGMQAALADIQAGRADTLICANISRYSRDVEHQQQIKKTVRSAGGRLVFCDMDFDDTPEGDLNFTIQGGFAEYEKAVIRKRTMKGRRKRATQGIQTARGWSPYGYTIPKTNDIIAGRFSPETIGQYLVNEPEAAIVRWLFAEYAAGNYSLPGLTRHLNTQKVPTKQGAALWQPPTVRGMLVNTAYIGKPKYGKLTCRKDERQLSQVRASTGEFYKSAEVRRPSAPEDVIELSSPPLVDEATWEAVQERLATNKARRGGNPCRTHLLSGTVVCDVCGTAMQMHGGRPAKGYPSYYSCGKHRGNLVAAGEKTCANTESFQVPVVENGVITAIEAALVDQKWIDAALRTYRQSCQSAPAPKDARRELAAANKALEDLQHQEAAAVQAQIAGIMAGASADAYASVFSELAARRKDIEDRRGTLRRTLDKQPEGGTSKASDKALLTRALADVGRVLRSDLVPTMEKRQAVMKVVDRVHCRRDGAVVVFRSGLFSEDADTLKHDRCSFF